MDNPLTAIQVSAPNTISYNTDTYLLLGVLTSPNVVAIVFINADSGENYITVEGNPGVSGLNAWHSGDALVEAAAQHSSTVIAVAHTVDPIVVENWVDLPQVKAVLFAHFPGHGAGARLTDILFGSYSPSSRLPYSTPKQVWRD